MNKQERESFINNSRRIASLVLGFSRVSAMRPDHALRDWGSITFAYLLYVFLVLKPCRWRVTLVILTCIE
jgi:hypothetical protein